MPDSSGNVNFTAPGGFSASATGFLAPVSLVMLAIGISMVYLVNAEVARGNIAHQDIHNNISRLADAIEVQNWLHSLPEKQRPRLLKPFGADRYIEHEVSPKAQQQQFH